MELDEVMDVVKEIFDNNVSAEIDDFCGDSFATITGKDKFYSDLEKELKIMQDKEDQELGIVRGEDARKFFERMEKNNRDYEKRKK